MARVMIKLKSNLIRAEHSRRPPGPTCSSYFLSFFNNQICSMVIWNIFWCLNYILHLYVGLFCILHVVLLFKHFTVSGFDSLVDIGSIFWVTKSLLQEYWLVLFLKSQSILDVQKPPFSQSVSYLIETNSKCNNIIIHIGSLSKSIRHVPMIKHNISKPISWEIKD